MCAQKGKLKTYMWIKAHRDHEFFQNIPRWSLDPSGDEEPRAMP